MNVINEIQRINEIELEKGLVGTAGSWHSKYSDSAWVYVGNLPLNLTEGDVICILSQFGEIEDINLVREEETGKSRGFAFVKYEDSRSCILAVDNFCGTKVLGRSLRVDHCEKYRLPKELLEKEEDAAGTRTDPGHAYEGKELANEYSIHKGQDLFSGPAPPEESTTQKTSKEQRKLAKKKRKEERDQRRRDKEERRQRKEEKRRQKRARSLADEDYGSEKGNHKKRHRNRRDDYDD